MMRGAVILAAGGTGGHVMPAAALASALAKAGYKPFWITDARGAEFRSAFGDTARHQLPVASHMHGGLLGKVKALASILKATLACTAMFLKDRPRTVIGFGGYPSTPPVLAAQLIGIPIVLHEQNAVMGRVNRWLARRAVLIAHGMPELRLKAGTKLPCVYVGNPVRASVHAAVRPYRQPDAGADIHLLVIGGSQGARMLSDLMPAATAALTGTIKTRLKVMHQARPEDVDRVNRAYKAAGIAAEVQSFFRDIGQRLAQAHLVIARAGASTLSEIGLHGRPAFLLPLPIAADDHQRANAKSFVAAGAAVVVDETAPEAATVLADLLRLWLEDGGQRLTGAAHAMTQVAVSDADDRMMAALRPILGAV